MKKWSVLLAVLLVLAALPVSAFAAEDEGAQPPSSSRVETPAGPDGEGSPGGEEEPVAPPEEGDGTDPGGPVEPGDDPVDPDGDPVDPDGGPVGPDGEEGDEPPADRPQLETEEHVAYIKGSGDMVRPLDPLTRAEAAQIVYSLLRQPPAGGAGAGFSDVPAGAWYEEVVGSLAAAGLLSGYPDGSFGPMNCISRAEYVTIFTRCFEPREADLPFTDVEGHWAREQLATAVSYGWLNGYADGTVRPNAPITRAEAVAIANRVLGRKGDLAALEAAGWPLQFLDISPDNWAYADIMEASLPHSHQGPAGGEVWTGCTVPAAQRAPGYYLVGGELYCVDSSGYYVRDRQVGVLQFDSLGRYVTGDSQLDQRLTQVVRQYAVEGDSAYNNLRRLYIYVMSRYTYRANTFVPDGASGWEARRALPMLQNGKGNCYDYAALFTMLARKLGYQAQGRSGWIRTDSWSWDEHGWTEITAGGETLLCDPEFQGVYVPGHNLNWDLFMKPYGSTPTHYRVAGRVLG